MRVAIFIAAVGVARGDENRDALMSIYTSTGGANWHVSTNWGVGDDYCKCVLSDGVLQCCRLAKAVAGASLHARGSTRSM